MINNTDIHGDGIQTCLEEEEMEEKEEKIDIVVEKRQEKKAYEITCKTSYGL